MHLDDSDLADLLQVIRVRVLGFLERKGIIESRHELTLLDDDFAERDPALAQLAAAAVSGLLPAGPDIRQRPAIALRGQPGLDITGPLSVTEMGLSLHAATTASAEDARGREGSGCRASSHLLRRLCFRLIRRSRLARRAGFQS